MRDREKVGGGSVLLNSDQRRRSKLARHAGVLAEIWKLWWCCC